MSLKRRNTSSPECESSSKRQRSQPAKPAATYDGAYDNDDEAVNVTERPQIDTYTGQSGAFPGLGNNDGDELFYGPANDGIDYLRMVRSEAKGIPYLLRAQVDRNRDAADEYDEREEEDECGYWDDDGTFTARPDIDAAITESSLPPAQLYYNDSLIAQFNVVRAKMKFIPPFSAIETLTSSQPISFPSESRKARSTWKRCLLKGEPSPVQVACMDENSIFEFVRLVTAQMRGLFQVDDIEVVRRFSTWIWAMLGKCPDRGELGSDEVSELRELARKAVDVREWLERKNRNRLPAAEENAEGEGDEEVEEEEDDDDDDLGMNIEAARRRLENKNVGSDESIPSSTNSVRVVREGDANAQAWPPVDNIQAAKREKMVVLDMILTVVGEVYGQRDLLELREPWDAISPD